MFKFVVTIEPENDTNCGNCPFVIEEDEGGENCIIFQKELKRHGGWDKIHSPRRLPECVKAEEEATS